MNILLVNWQDRENPQAGGAEIHLFELFSRLAAAGHRVRLVCSGWTGAPASASVDGIEVHRSGDRNSFALVGRAAVRRALRAEAPDILVEDVNKIPLYCGSLTDRPLCAIIPHLFGDAVFHEASLPLATAVWLAERPLARGYRRAGFHAISESTRDDLVARGVPPGRIRVIHPGVDAVHFRPDPAVPRTQPPSFLYVGRLKRYKGVDVAIRALALVRRSRPEIRLDIAGRGDHQPALEALARELGVEDGVTFHGFVTEEQKLRLLRSTWANVFPSPKEGWGITVMEAAACGTPSLASDSPGLRDSVRDGLSGHLVPHGDAAALAARMLELAHDPARVEVLGRAAREVAVGLTWDAAARATDDHLHHIIDSSARR
jgi:glycosyltransferase involved in cell wall biosynthesis